MRKLARWKEGEKERFCINDPTLLGILVCVTFNPSIEGCFLFFVIVYTIILQPVEFLISAHCAQIPLFPSRPP